MNANRFQQNPTHRFGQIQKLNIQLYKASLIVEHIERCELREECKKHIQCLEKVELYKELPEYICECNI